VALHCGLTGCLKESQNRKILTGLKNITHLLESFIIDIVTREVALYVIPQRNTV